MKLLLLLSIGILLGTPGGFTDEGERDDIHVDDAASIGLLIDRDILIDEIVQEFPVHNSGEVSSTIILIQ